VKKIALQFFTNYMTINKCIWCAYGKCHS